MRSLCRRLYVRQPHLDDASISARARYAKSVSDFCMNTPPRLERSFLEYSLARTNPFYSANVQVFEGGLGKSAEQNLLSQLYKSVG